MPESPLSKYALSAARSFLPMLANMRVIMCDSSSLSLLELASFVLVPNKPPELSASLSPPSSPPMPTNIDVMSNPVDRICSG